MARVRKLDANGDYSFGQGEANFWVNNAAGVAQNVETRLGLLEGEWFLDKNSRDPLVSRNPWLQHRRLARCRN